MFTVSLFAFIGVASFGAYMLKKRARKDSVRRWMINAHGAGAVGAAFLLMYALYESDSMGHFNEWNWIAAALLSSVVVGAYYLFRVLLKRNKIPLTFQFIHGLIAIFSVLVLAYSIII